MYILLEEKMYWQKPVWPFSDSRLSSQKPSLQDLERLQGPFWAISSLMPPLNYPEVLSEDWQTAFSLQTGPEGSWSPKGNEKILVSSPHPKECTDGRACHGRIASDPILLSVFSCNHAFKI
jgi:hypothetical protein